MQLIILCRHAQSVGNANRTIHQTVPDHRVPLTDHGRAQAVAAGDKLAALLLPTDTLQIITSPYTRTRETTLGILASSLQHHPNAAAIRVYEEPRLREQDFGNFQPCQIEMTRVWHERYAYGHFFYRIPNGESAADAYDRVSGFNESLWRQFADDDFPSVLVLVTHGLMARIFLMKWYHYSVEYFEDLRNVDHCEFVVMHKNAVSDKYDLQTELRTWSGYTHQHEELRYRCPPIAPYPISTANANANATATATATAAATTTTTATATTTATDPDSDPDSDRIPSYDPNYNPRKPRRPAWGEKQYGGCVNGCSHDWDGIRGVTNQYVMKGGRDFGGSRSGATSRAPSESSDGHGSDPDPDPDHDGANSTGKGKENNKKEKRKGKGKDGQGAAHVEGVVRDLGRMAVGGR